MKPDKIAEILNKKIPLAYSKTYCEKFDAYDNSGFLVNAGKETAKILFSLDLAGIAVSSGSACSSGSLEPSHVLLAIGVDVALAHGSIRFSFGKENTMEEVDYVVDTLKSTVERLRNMSPLYSVVTKESQK